MANSEGQIAGLSAQSRTVQMSGRALGKGTAYLAGLIAAAAFALPFFWMVSTSLKVPGDVFISPPTWIPWPLQWQTYLEAWTFIPFFSYTINTLQIAIPSIFGVLLSCTLTAYGFARIRAWGRNVLFFICLSTMMIPWAVTMVPVFVIFKNLGWTGTYLPLIVPNFLGGAFYIFLLRQFFLTIPMELSDAARVDGCSELGIFARVILPLSKPVLATVTLFEFNRVWSDYLAPLIFLTRQEHFTIALGLTYFLDRDRPLWNLAMAGNTMAILPVIIVFTLAQRAFIEGITLTGIKG